MEQDLKNKIGYIYKITAPNGKIYIGQTIRLKNRKSSYKNERFKNSLKLWNSCKKYNWNPIDTFEIIEECISGEDKFFLNEREVYWIKFYDSFKNGLNCTCGGKGNLGRIPSIETRKKMSKARLGKPLSKETIEKLKKPKENKENYGKFWKDRKHKSETIKKMKNKIIPEEQRKKISETKMGCISPRKGVILSEETKEKMKMSKIGCVGTTTGRICINKNKINKKVKKEELENYLNNGWVKGIDKECFPMIGPSASISTLT